MTGSQRPGFPEAPKENPFCVPSASASRLRALVISCLLLLALGRTSRLSILRWPSGTELHRCLRYWTLCAAVAVSTACKRIHLLAMASVTTAAQAICVPSSVALGVPQSHLSSVRMASPLCMPAVAPLRFSRRLHIVAATPTKPDLAAQVEKSIQEAQEVCAGAESSGECVAAWDEVEELSATAAHKRVAEKESKDPLEAYCKENPETDECRVYED